MLSRGVRTFPSPQTSILSTSFQWTTKGCQVAIINPWVKWESEILREWKVHNKTCHSNLENKHKDSRLSRRYYRRQLWGTNDNTVEVVLSWQVFIGFGFSACKRQEKCERERAASGHCCPILTACRALTRTEKASSIPAVKYKSC